MFETKEDQPPSNVLVISHGHCSDGFASAWIAHKVFPKAQFHFASFGEAPPEVAGKEVFILDFSYKRPTLLKMKAKAKSLTVLDHHKTAASELDGLSFCIFDMKRSGAGLTWDYFSHFTYPGFSEPMPWLACYVQDRDLWKHELPNTKAVNAAIASYPFDFEKWDDLAARSVEEVAEDGEGILRYQEQVASDLVSNAREVDLDGYKVLAVNTSILNSDVGAKLARNRPFGVVWFQRDDGKYVYSLRSSPEGEDVSQIALRHGGGGHCKSSGFVQEKLIF